MAAPYTLEVPERFGSPLGAIHGKVPARSAQNVGISLRNAVARIAHPPNETFEAATRALPSRIAGLISPAVLAARAKRIAVRLEDLSGERARRQRCVEIVASHLLEAYTNDAEVS